MGFWSKWFGKRDAEIPEAPRPSVVSARASSGAVATIVRGPDGSCGFFERAYDAGSATVELRYAFREDLPAWIDDVPVPLVPGKGIPIVTYATLRAMKQLGIEQGEARAFVLRCVHEVRSIVHLDWLTRKFPDSPLGELARKTHSYEYAETAIVQSGHKVVAVRVDEASAVRRPIGDLLAHYERMSKDPAAAAATHDAILAKYESTRSSEVLIGYDLRIQVAPWT
jgi:hypothetical protein